jgi:Bacterial archaeo-eukaryotic release factor family 11
MTQDAQASRIELKNLAASAAEQMEAAGAARPAVTNLRESLDDLVEDDDFWAEQSHSLAVFGSPAGLQTFRLPNRLTREMDVADRFYVKPLLRAVTFPQAAFVLALAAGSVRLVEITRDVPAFIVKVPDLPADAASAAGKASLSDRAPVRRIQGSEGQKLRLRQYARKVDEALRAILAGLELPLILAAADPLDSIYRTRNSYPHLVERRIPGHPEGLRDEELAVAAWNVLDGVHADELAAIRDRFTFFASRDRASSDVATVAHAATRGAVRTLLVDIDQKVRGRIDEATGTVTFSGDDDTASYGVVDEIARRVLLSGGDVLAVRGEDLGVDGALAAILRYPL